MVWETSKLDIVSVILIDWFRHLELSRWGQRTYLEQKYRAVWICTLFVNFSGFFKEASHVFVEFLGGGVIFGAGTGLGRKQISMASHIFRYVTYLNCFERKGGL